MGSVKNVLSRVSRFVARWATLPARWRKYQDILDADLKICKEFNGWAVHFGYPSWNRMEAACAIARRCAGAEEALKRIAANQEADARATGAPGLTAGEIERLAVLAQECGEVARAVGKVLQVGWKGSSGGIPIRIGLERGMGEMRAAVDMMLSAGDVRHGDVSHWHRSKRDMGSKGMQHQLPSQMPRGSADVRW